MSVMQEIELKFQIPEAALEAVRAEIQRLDAGQHPELRLRAAYVDTPDRRLAHARMALRVRQEGEDWVQTLKAGGSNTMMRLEDNQACPPPPAGHPLRADLSLHQGAAREALARTLGWSPDHDPHGTACGLIELYGTDMVRHRARILVAQGTPYEGEVELALDLGCIHAGPLSVPVRELEIESVSGHPMAVILAGRDWVARHGVWLDTQTKAHRGDRLARQAAALAAGQPSASTEALHTVLPKPAKVAPADTLDDAWRRGLEACLEHLTGNLSELAGAPQDTAALVYQSRLAMRRLSALARVWRDTPWALPGDTLAKASRLHRQLGYWRDQAALAWLPERLQAVTGEALPLPCPPALADQPLDAVALARSGLATQLALDLLTLLLLPAPTCEEAARPVQAWLPKRLHRQRRQLVRAISHLDDLDEASWHALRKRGKRLRLACALYQTLWSPRAQRRHDKRLQAALTALGQLQDEVLAHHWYAELAASSPPAQAACAWLQGRQSGLRRRARRALTRWQARPSPWHPAT